MSSEKSEYRLVDHCGVVFVHEVRRIGDLHALHVWEQLLQAIDQHSEVEGALLADHEKHRRTDSANPVVIDRREHLCIPLE